MIRSVIAGLAASAALLAAGAAHAGTHWSIGINVPLPGVAVSSGGYYVEPAPVYYAPPPPPPVYVPAPRYVERDVYYAPLPRIVYETTYRDRRWDDRRWDDRRWHRDHDCWDRDDYGPRRGR